MSRLFFGNRFDNYQARDLKKDMIAGVTVGIVAIPLAMAFAIASGVKPEYGIYSTIIAGLIVALFGGSRFQIAGPTGAFIPILLAIVLQYGYQDLLIAGLLAGMMLVLMGAFKLGSLIKYIPRSVTIGFTAGIAVIIFTGQIGNFLGLQGVEKKELFHENMIELFNAYPTLNLYSIITAGIGVLTIILIPRLLPKVPVLLAALIIPTLIAVIFFPTKVDTIGTAFGGISQSLPTFQIPMISLSKIIELLGPAFVIAILGGIESLLSAVVADGMTGKRHDSNRELIGQGIANIVTPLVGGIPATGAIARTATNIKSGAVSPLSGIFHSVFVLLTLLLFAPFASHIPLASMAPILMTVAWNMSERRSFWNILKLRTSDSLVLLLTFLLTVFVNLTVAVQVGLLLAMASFVKRMSQVLEVDQVIPKGPNEQVSKNALTAGTDCPQFSIFTIEGPLFFGAADKFTELMSRSIRNRPKVLLFRMAHVSFIDATGLSNFEMLVHSFLKKGGIILVSGIREQPLEILQKSGLYEKIGEHNFFPRTGPAINYALTFIEYKICHSCKKSAFYECASFKSKEKVTEGELQVASAEES